MDPGKNGGRETYEQIIASGYARNVDVEETTAKFFLSFSRPIEITPFKKKE